MRTDKVFLRFSGESLFERVLEVFTDSFENILLVGDREERFSGYSLPMVQDIYPGSALGGLYTGLHYAATRKVFVSPCDLPFPNKDLLRFLCSLGSGFDAVVPRTEHGFEPLFALYAKTCLVPMKNLLENSNLRIYDFYPLVRVRYVSSKEMAHLDADGRSFININTPEDFARLEKEYRR